MPAAPNKTQPTTASVEAFLNAVPDAQKRADAFTLLALMHKATKVPPKMWGTAIVGFDQYHYRYASGHEGDACVIGFSSRKGPISIYMAAGCDVDQGLLAQLGKHKMGKGCLYVHRLADVDVAVLEKLLARSAQRTKKRYPAQ